MRTKCEVLADRNQTAATKDIMPIIPILIAVPLFIGGALVVAAGCAPHLWDGEWSRINEEWAAASGNIELRTSNSSRSARGRGARGGGVSLVAENGSVLRTADNGANRQVCPTEVAAAIAQTRYGFEELRVRLGTVGRPMPVRTARDVSQQISRMRLGMRWVWTEQAVAQWELKRTIKK